MLFLRSLMILGLGFSAACSSGDEEMIGQDDDRADQVIDYLLPDSSTNISIGDRFEGAITYGRCEVGESTEPIEINCGTPWSEVTWLQVSAADIALSREMGKPLLKLDLGLTEPNEFINRLRVSVHAVNAEGQTRKIASDDIFVDGESLEVFLADDLDHYIYVARSQVSLTSTRTVEFSLSVTTAEENIAPTEL